MLTLTSVFLTSAKFCPEPPGSARQYFRNPQDWSGLRSGKAPKTHQNRQNSRNPWALCQNLSGIVRPRRLPKFLRIYLMRFLENLRFFVFRKKRHKLKTLIDITMLTRSNAEEGAVSVYEGGGLHARACTPPPSVKSKRREIMESPNMRLFHVFPSLTF